MIILAQSWLTLTYIIGLGKCNKEGINMKMKIMKNGKFTSKAKGHNSDVDLTIRLSDGRIEDVDINVEGESSSRNDAVVAQLSKQIIEKQSDNLDAVTGATETSNAVRRALTNCLSQAQGSDSISKKKSLKDGVYEETVPSYSLIAPMTGRVTIKDNTIKDIEIISEKDSQGSPWFKRAQSKLIPRLLESQSLDTDAITGASASSGAIKAIIEKAINDAGGNSDQWHTPVAKKDNTVVKKGYDVIVVGLGGSGILSYCSAADNGARVFGIEAAGGIGGNSISTSGPMVVNSKIQSKKYNDGQDNINEKDLYDTWIDYVKTDKKADVIKKAIEEDGPALDYYMKKFGFSFDGAAFGMSAGYYPSFVRPDWDKEWTIYSADNNHWYSESEPDHLPTFQNALDKAKMMNPANDYQLELKATEFIKDNENKVIGVRAKSYDGTKYEVYGKAIVLASGGFIGNKEMMRQVYGHTCHVFGSTVAQGDGIKMGQSAGGTTYALGTLPMIHISQVPNIIRDASLTPDQKAILSALATTSDAKKLDETGQILESKDESGTDDAKITVGIAYAPGFKYFNAYTKADLDKIKTSGLSDEMASVIIILLDQGGKLPASGVPVKDLDKILDEAIKHGDAWKGTPAKLAKDLKMDEEKLTKALGDSEEEYYLFEADSYAYATCGGLDVDVNMNVLRKDGTPIENVFAVGQDSEGVENRSGQAYTPWGGQAQAWTFVSGKIAGENAAKVK